jgi:hypothetical protein
LACGNRADAGCARGADGDGWFTVSSGCDNVASDMPFDCDFLMVSGSDNCAFSLISHFLNCGACRRAEGRKDQKEWPTETPMGHEEELEMKVLRCLV